jgi:hypothetical protein
VTANRELIVRFEAKIAKVLARVWGGERFPDVRKMFDQLMFS